MLEPSCPSSGLKVSDCLQASRAPSFKIRNQFGKVAANSILDVVQDFICSREPELAQGTRHIGSEVCCREEVL